MLNSRIYVLGIMLIGVLIGCDSDDIAPEINLLDAANEFRIFKSEQLIISAEFSDNKDLASATAVLTFDDGSIQSETIELENNKATGKFTFSFTDEPSGTMQVAITALDDCGNSTSEEFDYQYYNSAPGTLDLNIKLKYNDEPLVMFQNYEYPDGRLISFNRFSFYISELKLDDTKVKDVEYINLTNANADLSVSTIGYDWVLPRIAPGNYENMNFLVGVTSENNEKTPGEYANGTPLANPAEHWFSWNSYIFLKVEGYIDLDNNGDRETGFALHLGSNDALRAINLPNDISINSGARTSSEMVIDLYDFFGGDGEKYDIDANTSIHALAQLDAVVSLSNNIPQSFK